MKIFISAIFFASAFLSQYGFASLNSEEVFTMSEIQNVKRLTFIVNDSTDQTQTVSFFSSSLLESIFSIKTDEKSTIVNAYQNQISPKLTIRLADPSNESIGYVSESLHDSGLFTITSATDSRELAKIELIRNDEVSDKNSLLSTSYQIVQNDLLIGAIEILYSDLGINSTIRLAKHSLVDKNYFLAFVAFQVKNSYRKASFSKNFKIATKVTAYLVAAYILKSLLLKVIKPSRAPRTAKIFNRECPICLCEFGPENAEEISNADWEALEPSAQHDRLDQGKGYAFPCRHAFHDQCIKEYIEHNPQVVSCPNCRSNMATGQQREL